MCKETTTTYTLCACRVPSIDRCPRCSASGYKGCIDFTSEKEEQRGVCVGLGTCPATVGGVAVKEESEGKGGRDEGVGLGAIDWGEIFGLVGSCGD